MNLSGQSEARSAPSEAELDQATPRKAGGREVRVGGFLLLGALAFGDGVVPHDGPGNFPGTVYGWN